jgi:hypothetical protein
MRRFFSVLIIFFIASGCVGGSSNELTEAGVALRTALTAETFGDFRSGADTIKPGSPAAHKFAAIENEYQVYFQSGHVSAKKNLSETNESFQYCIIGASDDGCKPKSTLGSDSYFEVSSIMEESGLIIDFNFSRGPAVGHLAGVDLGIFKNRAWAHDDGSFGFSVLSAYDDGEGACFAIDFYTYWDETSFIGSKVSAFTFDEIWIEGSSTPYVLEFRPGVSNLVSLCFDYQIDAIDFLEFDGALTWSEGSGYNYQTWPFVFPVEFNNLYMSD